MAIHKMFYEMFHVAICIFSISECSLVLIAPLVEPCRGKTQ